MSRIFEFLRWQKNKEKLKVYYTKDSSNQDDPLNPAPTYDDKKFNFDKVILKKYFW